MLSPFDRAEAILSRAVDRTFASTVRILPRALGGNVNSRPRVDPTRPPKEVRAIISRRPVEGGQVGKARMISTSTGAAMELSVDVRELAGLDLRQGDRVESGLSTYEITETRVDGSRVVASLVNSGRSNFE